MAAAAASKAMECGAEDSSEKVGRSSKTKGTKLKVRTKTTTTSAAVDTVGGKDAHVEEVLGNVKVSKVGRDDGEELKRKRVAEDEAEGKVVAKVAKEDKNETPRYKRRKLAIFVSYSGCGYQGMQRNKGAKTIEGDLEEALFKAGAIAESFYGDPRKVDWARAARTDKGVSAVGQVVSGQFLIDPPGLVERVNSHLPKQIRVLGYTRVTAGFNAKKLCDRRRYEYVLPLFTLDPASHRNDDKEPAENSEDDGEVEDGKRADAPLCTCPGTDSSDYVFGEAEKEKLNGILKNYVGTHNFHNFTCRIKPEDPSTQRYIISYEAGDVFTIGGSKFVRCTVVGQSFMLHQIRKMIGLAVAVMRGFAPESIFETTFKKDVKITVPMAPELGLFLDECLYTAYNQRFSETHAEVSLKEFEKEIADFKAEVIYPHIESTEAKDKVFARWLHGLTRERYPDFATSAPS